MRMNKIIMLSLALLLVVACSLFTPSAIPSNTTPTNPADAAREGNSEGSGEGGVDTTPTAGSADFSAQATSPQSILLTWKTVEGATGYNLEYGWNGKDFHPLVSLPPGLTQYEDFSALPDFVQSYRLQPVTAAGEGNWLHADGTTPAASPNPITVNPTFDNAKMVRTTIGNSGGSVSITDEAGVKYQLDIPAGALAEDTEIQLTPLIGLDGWPLDGERLAAVRIDPGGLQLAEVGTLTITLKSSGNADLATVGFAFKPTGGEFHLESLSPSPDESYSLPWLAGHLAAPALQTEHVITLPVIELTVHGVGQGSTSTVTELARNNPPTDAGAAIDQQQTAEAAYQSDLASLVNISPPPNTGRNEAAVRLEKEMVKIWEQIDAANDGNSLDAALQQFQKWDRDTHGLTTEEYQSLAGTFKDDFINKFIKLLDKAARDCKKSDVYSPPNGIGPLQDLLLKLMNPPSSGSVWDQLQSGMTSAYGDNVLSDAWSNLKQGLCGTFLVYKPAGSKGTICSLSRHFTIEEIAPFINITIDFYPITMTMGTVNVHEDFTAADATIDGVGTYDLVFYTPKEANIQVEWVGHYVQPGVNIPETVGKPLHYDLQSVVGADCP